MFEEAVYEMLPVGRHSVPELRGAQDFATSLANTSRDIPLVSENGGHTEAKSQKRPSFKISLKRDVYFDNDVLEGTLSIESTSEFVIPKLTVAIVCRLIVKDRVIPELKSAHTLYKSSKVCTGHNAAAEMLYCTKLDHVGCFFASRSLPGTSS